MERLLFIAQAYAGGRKEGGRKCLEVGERKDGGRRELWLADGM